MDTVRAGFYDRNGTKDSELVSSEPDPNTEKVAPISEVVARWLTEGGGGDVALPAVLDALRRPDGLPVLLRAASAVVRPDERTIPAIDVTKRVLDPRIWS